MIPTVREKKEVFVTKYDTQIADKTYTVTFQDTKEKDYTIDDIIEHILENVINAESYARYTNQKYYTEIILNLKEDVLWYFEAKVLDPNGDEHWMKSIAEYDIFNKRMTIKEAKEYINKEVDYYTIVDVKPIYNLGFLTK